LRKKIIFVSLVLIYAVNIQSKDFKRTEDIINSIIKDPIKKKEPTKHPKEDRDIKSKSIDKKSGDKEKEAESLAMSGDDEALLKTGIQLYNSGLYRNSLKNFKELNEKYPQSPYVDNSKLWIGKIRLKLYEYNSAIKEFSSIPKDSGEYPTALYYTAESYMLKGNIISSIEFYQKVSFQFPEHELADNALLKSGKLYLDKKKGSQALESAIKLIKYYKSRETIDDAYYLLGKIFERDLIHKDIESARKVYKIFLKKAVSGVKQFKNSPLINRVKQDLNHLEKRYFSFENTIY